MNATFFHFLQSYHCKINSMQFRKAPFLVGLLFVSVSSFSQGLGIPSKKGVIGFGNLPVFTGVRFNFVDKNVEKVNGINVTVWQTKDESLQSGTVNGISLGLPLAMGSQNKNGIGVGIFGVAATKNLAGVNIGGLGVGAGGNVTGLNVGGLGIGSGGNLKGINIGGLGAGSGGDVYGVNIGGLGIGAGGDLVGFSFGGLGVGGGDDISGISFGGLGVGAGGDIKGISFGGLGVGAGKSVKGFAAALLGVGAGKELKGIIVSGLAAGSPKVSALAIAPLVGGERVQGFIIAPAHLLVGGNKKFRHEEVTTTEVNGLFKGVSISAYNKINGQLNGVSFGVVNYTQRIKGVQFGLINIVKENPKGLRVLPFFNMRFGKKGQ